MTVEELQGKIEAAFADVPPPPDWAIVDSLEGSEPLRVEAAFRDKRDWRSVEPTFLDEAPDGLASALTFFSAEAFRFFLPAYLLADIRGQLAKVNVVFNLVHGFARAEQSEKINEQRYGARTWFDFEMFRFSTLSREQAAAVAAYLEWKVDTDEGGGDSDILDALETYWRPRGSGQRPRIGAA